VNDSLILSATVVAESLGFPEGPLVLGEGRIAFVEQYPACVSVYEAGAVTTLAVVGGCPNGLAQGPDGRIYFTQNSGGGGTYRCPDPKTPGIFAIDPDGGPVQRITTTASGRALRQPNDLCFGPDGALYFTDPGDEPREQAGWICRHLGEATEIVHELGPSFPNGIGFDADDRLLWAETRTKRIMASGSPPSVVAQLDEKGSADGFAFCRDGTLVAATLWSGGLDVVSPGPDGRRAVRRETWAEGVVATNCAFEGQTLWVTDASSTPDETARPTGRLWRLETQLDGKTLSLEDGCS
jgi:gluconolactonase